MLKAGIVGLPNVGKSTLFNAITRSRKAEAANFPFCTIEPNMGVVTVPDPRLERIAQITHPRTTVPTIIEFVDIAGLVKGASHGEGRGNRFLSHIREVDAIIQVVRCFEDPDVVHVAGAIDPIRDIEIVTTELELADLESIHRRLDRLAKEAKRGDKAALAEEAVLKKLAPHLDAGKAANTLELTPEEKAVARGLFLLTAKPTIFAANVPEQDLATADTNPHVTRIREYARSHHACETVVVSAKIEADLGDLTPEEGRELLKELGVQESGVDALIRSTYQVLGLRTFFTTNEKEAHAWTIHAGDTAPKAAGQVHTDFERGFIKAETVSCKDLFACGSFAHAREKGLYRIEGKDYVVQDGDIILFRFHV
jgi:GTP-binding protein YchF